MQSLPLFLMLHGSFGADLESPLAGAVTLADTGAAVDDAAGGKSGPGTNSSVRHW